MLAPAHFAPFERLADHLLKAVPYAADDGSHDASHILRVWQNVQRISRKEGGDLTILVAATILHDCVPVAKESAQRSSASALAAKRAAEVLDGLGWADSDIKHVCHAIEAHSFSARVEPQTLEAKILQDADRLDAIGHIGIARCFYVAGRMGNALYDPADSLAAKRQLDDRQFALDHFRTKLLRLTSSFQTDTGRALAAERHEVTRDFVDGLCAEIGPDS